MKKYLISIILGITLTFIIGWITITIWLSNNTVDGTINLFGLGIAKVTFEKGQPIKDINNISMIFLGILFTEIIHTILLIFGYKKK